MTLASLVPSAWSYEPTRDLNHWGIRAKFGFNLRADFEDINPSAVSGLPLGPTGSADAPRVYDDGYVKPDAANGGLGQSWNWGYQNAGQYDAAGNGGQGTIAMHASSVASSGSGGNAQRGVSSNPEFGWELSYGRDFGAVGDGWWGLEGAVGMTLLSIDRNFSQHGNINYISDLFNLGGSIPPGASYAGTFNGPGATVDLIPLGRTTLATPGDTYGRNKLDTTLVSFRFGPYLELPAGKRWTFSLSGGPAFAFFDGSYSYDQRTTQDGGATYTPNSGSGSDTGLLAGFYLDGRVHYALDDQWSLFGGAQYNYLTSGKVAAGERVARMKMGAGVFVELGIGFSY